MAAAQPDTRSTRFSAIWIIPLVAAALGAWMVVYTYLSEGPEIEIRFKTADGLEAGKTRLKYRNVEMGMVQKIILSDDLQDVIAVVKLRREAVPLLGEDTRFWVVTARIAGGAISGLDTLLSGAYIEVSPATTPANTRHFVALEKPPLTPAGAPGLRLVLLNDRSASVSSGDPVLYNGFKVGRVESLDFDPESRQIRYDIFIDAPYHSLVDSSVRFWDVSGITLNADAEGFRVATGSLESIVLGGVTFAHAPGLGPGEPVEHETEFRLYGSYDAILEAPFAQRSYYIVAFDQSLQGLSPGAPVQYRGIQIGEVERILVRRLLDKNPQGGPTGASDPIPVLIYLEPARIEMPDTGESLQTLHRVLEQGVEKGLRASLATGNLLTGAQLVEIRYYDDLPVAGLGQFEGYPTIPTIASGLGQLETKVSALLDKVQGLPLETTVNAINRAAVELNQTLVAVRDILDDRSLRGIPAEIQTTLATLRVLLENDSLHDLPVELERAVTSLREILERDSIRAVPDELRSTLSAARFHLQGESTESYQLLTTLREVEAAARALREFLDLLKVKPEALIRGKTNPGE